MLLTVHAQTMQKAYSLRACQTEFGAKRDGVGFTVDGTEQQIQRANRHPTRPTRIRATKQEARPVKLSSGRRGPLCAHVFCQVWFLLIATWPSTSPAKGLWLAGRHPGMMCLLLLLPWTRQASNTVCWHEVPHHGNPAQCCLFTGNCSIILVLSC